MGDVLQFVQVPVSIAASPVVTRERFAEITGLPIGVVIGHVNRGYIPTINVGKYSLVNLELLRRRCLEKEMR